MMYVLVIVWGLALGSFVNALVWRTRQTELASKKQKAKSKKSKARKSRFGLSASRNRYSILTGRSMCPSCKHELAAGDLMPLISWLWLKGKCRYCKKPISWQYPAVELLTAILFAASYAFWPFTFSFELSAISLFIVWLLLLTSLIALAVYDQKWMELPDKFVAWVSGLTVVFMALQFVAGVAGGGDVLRSLWGGALLFGFFYVLFQVSGGKWIGGGDIKLAPALGVLAGGPLGAVLLLFIASLLGTIIGVPLMAIKKNKRRIKLPFGPLLIAGLLIVFFFGNGIIGWYLNDVLYL